MSGTETAITIGVITVALVGGTLLVRALYKFKKKIGIKTDTGWGSSNET